MAQTIPIDSMFTASTTIFPFQGIETITSLTADGYVNLLNDTSLVRIILEDEFGYQYMIFEAYRLICLDPGFSFSHHCDETCFLDEIKPYALILQLIDAELDLDFLTFTDEPFDNPHQLRFSAKRASDAVKIEAMNQVIPRYDMNWISGDNDIVALYYDQKRQRFGDGYNLRGYEYYMKGIFESIGHPAYPKSNPDLVWNFDWRNRHGANDSSSGYWDGDVLGTGWLTAVKDQGQCKSCWAFSAAGVTEALANIYNPYPHEDYDLSEQDLVSCSEAGSCGSGSSAGAVIDGGILTNACPDELWDGIEVWGSDTNQYFYKYFGVVNISNGGTIENARTAIANYCKFCEQYPYEAGGVIRTENAIFRNSRIAVDLAPYRNMWQGQEHDYRATFDKTQFIYDNYLNDYSLFEYFIKMEQVKGVKFYGCDFLCDTNSIYADKEKTYKYRSGIYSFASQFYVEDVCISQTSPCTQFKPSVFKGLNYGIYAMDVDGRKTATIKNSMFERNNTGIFLSAMDNSAIVQDTFIVTTGHFSKRDTICGLYLDHCTGYQIEENVFETYFNSMGDSKAKVGLFINNSGPHANEVYKNQFIYLNYGIVAMNENKKDSVGLCIKCNTFENCYSDISVVIDSSVRGWGIAEYQGSSQDTTTAPAGNVFTSDEYQNHVFDLFNHYDADPFTYFHHNEDITPEYNVEPNPDKCSESVSFALNNQRYDSLESCPSHIGSGINPSFERYILEEADNQIVFIESSLDLLVDGGNTQLLYMDVITSTPSEAIDLTNRLLSESPYLSDTVMKSAIEKEDVLSNAMIRDVLVENPQSAKSAEIMQLIDERQDPMPEFMKIEIAQGKHITGEKENLEARRFHHILEQARAFNNLYKYFQTDTIVVNPQDSLMVLLNEFDWLENRYRKTFIQLEIGDTNQARLTLDGIPLAFLLTVDQLNAHQKYEDLLGILIDLKIYESRVNSLDSTLLTGLFDICNNRTLPEIYARNLLVASGELHFNEVYRFPENLKKQKVKPHSKVVNIESAILRVFPNPASFYCIIDFNAKYSYLNGNINPSINILISDILGRNIKTLVSNKIQDQLVLDLRNFKSGLYLTQLYINGQRHASIKFIVNQ